MALYTTSKLWKARLGEGVRQAVRGVCGDHQRVVPSSRKFDSQGGGQAGLAHAALAAHHHILTRRARRQLLKGSCTGRQLSCCRPCCLCGEQQYAKFLYDMLITKTEPRFRTGVGCYLQSSLHWTPLHRGLPELQV